MGKIYLDDSHLVVGSMYEKREDSLATGIKRFNEFAKRSDTFEIDMNFGQWLDNYSSMITSSGALSDYLFELINNGEDVPQPYFTTVYHQGGTILGFRCFYNAKDFGGYRVRINPDSNTDRSFIDTKILRKWSATRLIEMPTMEICKPGSLLDMGMSSIRIYLLDNRFKKQYVTSSLIVNLNKLNEDKGELLIEKFLYNQKF